MAKSKKSPDKILLGTIITLIIIGLVALFSASIDESVRHYGNIYAYFAHQLVYGLFLGGVLGFIAYKIPYEKIQKMAPVVFLGSLFLTMLVFIPSLSVAARGAQRWIDLGFITFQPAEVVKLAFIIYLAAWLTTNVNKVKDKGIWMPFLIMLSVLGLLLLMQPDTSTYIIIVIASVIMYFVAGASYKHLSILGSICIAGLFLIVGSASYRLDRIEHLFNPGEDPLGLTYQITQSLISVGSGQITGAGPIQGTQKAFLPLPMNDAIFAVWAEEAGFIGATILILLFMVFAWRGFVISERVSNNFAKFTVVGITAWFITQALVNIGGMIGIIPITGLTLPFIGYGSSSMVVTLIAVGLMLQISKEAT